MAKKPNGGVPRGKTSTRHKAVLHGGRRGGKQSKQQVEAALAGPLKKKPAHPRDRPLPGMENVRIHELDAICVAIAEGREAMNALRHEDADNKIAALKRMRKHQKKSWRHAGVELERIEGEEKLRVRTARARTATAPVEEDVEAAAAPPPATEGRDYGDQVGEPSHTEPEDAPDLEDTVVGDDGIEAAPV